MSYIDRYKLDEHNNLFPANYLEREYLERERGSFWKIKENLSTPVLDDKQSKELHYLVLPSKKCIAIILNNNSNTQYEKEIRVKDSIMVEGVSYPVNAIWLTYSNNTYDKLDKLFIIVPKTVEYVHPVIEKYDQELLDARFKVDDNNPYLSSGEDGCLYDKKKTKLLLFGRNREEWKAPENLKSMEDSAFYGVYVKTIIFPKTFKRLGKEWKSAPCSHLVFEGQLTHIENGSIDNLKCIFRMNGLLSQLDDNSQQVLKMWYEDRREGRRRNIILASPKAMNGVFEKGVITLTQVFDLDRKLYERQDSSSILLNVNINKELCNNVGAGIPILVDSVKIDKEEGYRSDSVRTALKPLYETTWVTRIRLVPLVKPQEPHIMEILVHEKIDKVKELLQQAYKA